LQDNASDNIYKPTNLLIDATFFEREYGFLVFHEVVANPSFLPFSDSVNPYGSRAEDFKKVDLRQRLHDCQKVIYFKEIKTESIKDFREGIKALKVAKYSIQSIAIDGRRGYISNIKKLLGNIPIQMYLFHQKAIIRSYITDRPQSSCGKDLKELMKLLCKEDSHQEFIDNFYKLQDQYCYFLSQRNEFRSYSNEALRSAFRSIETNMLYLLRGCRKSPIFAIF